MTRYQPYDEWVASVKVKPLVEPPYLVLLPSEIRRLGGLKKIREDNPGVVVKVRKMIPRGKK